jgi:hypothetical protein
MAVNHDPNEIFNAFKLQVKERDELRDANNKLRAENNQLKAERNTLEIENKNVTENYESAKLDFRVARDKLDKMEQICAIQSAKQVVLFKMIDRLKNGQTGPPIGGDGFWLPVNGFPMAPVSEASEPSSEQSSGTMGSKDSCETKLDPHAVSSIAGESDFTDLSIASFCPPKSDQVLRSKRDAAE